MWAMPVVLVLLMSSALSSRPATGDAEPSPSAPLRLTPLLAAGDAAGARALAAVPALLPGCCSSYAGFLTVDAKHDSNLLFWFFPSETRQDTAPLIVWLQGGPGTSMMRPVFLENGPYRIDADTRKLGRRRGSWTRSHSMLYFDNPVGTGYSFTGDPDGLSKDVGQISANLVEALRQFFVMFPEQSGRDLYVAGESFGGKMATALAHAIHRLPAPLAASGSFRLKGLLVVNGLIEAESQIDKSDIAYQLGLVDEEGRDQMRAAAARQRQLIHEGNWAEARKLALDECGSAVSPQDTGMVGLTNFLLWNGTQDDGFQDLAQHERVRRALHVGNATFTGRATAVGRALRDDITRSVLPQLAELADYYHVLVASGQMDLCLPYRLTAGFLRRMEWRGAPDLAASRRSPWCVRGQLAGYARTTRARGLPGALTHVLVRNAGHYLGQDQPRWAAAMMRAFTAGDSFDTCGDRGKEAATIVRP
ncbi:hypothetical protein ONE63_009373 [Megalurothrips usitatus]|uniref:Venom serine carboxypeptidase-like n=1 Tax=Megalurothrips usitatus TaxID=439358 RepID=A0AAV7XR21_9NEOP|nr:hypothetical protein ONE63_009373 [Megalurothrips usitatus]